MLSAWKTMTNMTEYARHFLEKQTTKKKVADFATDQSTVLNIAKVYSDSQF